MVINKNDIKQFRPPIALNTLKLIFCILQRNRGKYRSFHRRMAYKFYIWLYSTTFWCNHFFPVLEWEPYKGVMRKACLLGDTWRQKMWYQTLPLMCWATIKFFFGKFPMWSKKTWSFTKLMKPYYDDYIQSQTRSFRLPSLPPTPHTHAQSWTLGETKGLNKSLKIMYISNFVLILTRTNYNKLR